MLVVRLEMSFVNVGKLDETRVSRETRGAQAASCGELEMSFVNVGKAWKCQHLIKQPQYSYFNNFLWPSL